MITKRALLILFLLASCLPRGWDRADPTIPASPISPLVAGPYLMRIDATSSAVVLREPLDAPPELVWWVGTGTKTTARFERRDSDLWVARMDALPPDVRVAYQVDSARGTVGPLQFRQDVSRGRSFRFAAFGDTRTGHQIHRQVVEAIAREQVEFVINSGDLVEFGGYDDQWLRFLAIEAPILVDRFLFPVVGNHDDSPQRLFERYFVTDLYAGGARYYLQDFGDVRFVAMDSEIELSPGSAQEEFLERALGEGAAKGQILVLSLHRPPYSSGSHGSSLEHREIVDELARTYGVELVLAGHDHDYERTHPVDGTTHIVAASAGATIRPVSPSDFTASLRTEPHFVLFDVDGQSLSGRAINLAGETFDSFVIPPNPPRPRR